MPEYKISIIGSGVVGTAVGRGFSELGYEVIFYDIDEKKIEKFRELGYFATTDLNIAILNSNVSFICVPTPLSEERTLHGYRKMNLKYVEEATKNIADVLKEKNGEYHTIAVKSTVLPDTAEKVIIPALEERKIKNRVGVCVNPEFLTEISETWTTENKFKKSFFNEDRYVIGEEEKNSRSGEILEKLYKKVNEHSGNNAPIERVSLREAAWIKLVANTCLATKISFFNDLFEHALKLGIDPHKTARIVGLDKRIGSYGTIHGKAFGGKCLPKDLEAFLAFCDEEVGDVPEILKAVLDVNNYMAKKYGVRE